MSNDTKVRILLIIATGILLPTSFVAPKPDCVVLGILGGALMILAILWEKIL